MREVICRAEFCDAAALSALARSNPFSAQWKTSDFESEIKNSFSRLYIARAEGEIAGFIAFRFCCGAAELTNFAVGPDFLRRGIGSALMAEGLKLAQAEGIENITLEVNENNLPAINLYNKFSFKTINIRKKFYNNSQDALLMLRKI